MSTPAAPLAAVLADRVTALRPDALPPAVVRAAQDHLLDALGVGFAGGAADTTSIGPDLSRLGSGDATVVGRDARLTPAHAALVNGTFMHALEFDDTHVPSVIHGSAVVVPAALAAAEREGASGAELLLSIAAAWETLIALGLAAPGRFQAAGFQTVAVAGPFGAAVAAGLLAGVPRDTLVHAFGICGSQAGGTFEFLRGGATVKAMHAGWAAQSGLLAVEMAQLGVTGPATVLEGPVGFYASYAHDDDVAPRLAPLIDGIGSTWELPNAAFKRYPVCHYIHPFLEAVESLLAEGLTAADVASVTCHAPVEAGSVISDPWDAKQRPSSDQEARYSLPVCVAAALLRGHLGPRDIPGIASDAAVLELASRIDYVPWVDSGFPARFPARIEVARHDGKRDEVIVADVRGSASRPLTTDDVRAKFRANASPVVGDDRAAALVDAVERLPALGDVRELTALLGA